MNDFDIVRKTLLYGKGLGTMTEEDNRTHALAALDRIEVEYKALVLARREHAEAAARYGAALRTALEEE